MNFYFEELQGWFPEKFRNEFFIVCSSGDAFQPDTIAESNLLSVEEELNENFSNIAKKVSHAYYEEISIPVCSLKISGDLSKFVLEVCETLQEYALYNESHYYEMREERLQEYIESELPYDLSHELSDVSVAKCEEWIEENIILIRENFDTGSIDDMPIDVEELAKHYRDRTRV